MLSTLYVDKKQQQKETRDGFAQQHKRWIKKQKVACACFYNIIDLKIINIGLHCVKTDEKWGLVIVSRCNVKLKRFLEYNQTTSVIT